MKEYVLSTHLDELAKEYPFIEDFFVSVGIRGFLTNQTLDKFLETRSDEVMEDCCMDREQLARQFVIFMEKMMDLKRKSNFSIKEISMVGGRDKSGNPENTILRMRPGEVLCIVGPTGSGKSRLLADIECLAQSDTPTGRKILINGGVPTEDQRFSIENKLVAQLSQNMNFIIDLAVREFVTMHAESRMVDSVEEVVTAIITCANELAGEKFHMDVPVTQLSGGQSRALMIADVAMLSESPIVLIDEIENAGVDRKNALELLVKKEKIVLMSTHDPILALMGDRRVVIKNGGIHKVIETREEEKANLETLQRLDAKMLELRDLLRRGEPVDFDIRGYLFDAFID